MTMRKWSRWPAQRWYFYPRPTIHRTRVSLKDNSFRMFIDGQSPLRREVQKLLCFYDVNLWHEEQRKVQPVFVVYNFRTSRVVATFFQERRIWYKNRRIERWPLVLYTPWHEHKRSIFDWFFFFTFFPKSYWIEFSQHTNVINNHVLKFYITNS